MKVKELIEQLKKVDGNAEMVISKYNRTTGATTQQQTHLCCNFEHQKKVNQVWLSDEGLML